MPFQRFFTEHSSGQTVPDSPSHRSRPRTQVQPGEDVADVVRGRLRWLGLSGTVWPEECSVKKR